MRDSLAGAWKWLSNGALWALAHLLQWALRLLQWALLFYGGNVLWGLLVALDESGFTGFTLRAVAHAMLLDWLLASLQATSIETLVVIAATILVYMALFTLSNWLQGEGLFMKDTVYVR